LDVISVAMQLPEPLESYHPILIELVELSTLPPLVVAGVQGNVYVPGTGIETGAAMPVM
jgi:hypothetical protein